MASSALRRALLYVPASSPRFLDKSRALAVDLCVYDLEDSVTASKKPEARKNVRELLSRPRPTGIREQAVRINSVESGLALDDLKEVVRMPFICRRQRLMPRCSSTDHT
jgi:citrate lyase subunit beta-like protein